MPKSIVVFLVLIAAAGLWLLAAHHTATPEHDPLWVEAPRDCSVDAADLPSGASRVFIELNVNDGSGSSVKDPRDGSTADSFDRILRCYSEGCTDAQHPQHSLQKTDNLIVCLGPGTYSTRGSYDYIINRPHQSQHGFTIGKGWKIHGVGRNLTTVKLVAFVPNTQESNPLKYPVNTGTGLVFGTNSDDASHIEISDLTIDANYPELKSRARQIGINALNLDAIRLRSDRGGHWIHEVKVLNTAGEIGGINIRWEDFPVWIFSANNASPTQSKDNLIENVAMAQSFGETGCAIAIANVSAEVRHSRVTGYPIGFGGWKMENVSFHDNIAENTEYGFNVDSLTNTAIRIENNQIIHPRKYGIVVGGDATFSDFRIVNNTISLDHLRAIGLLFRGNVSGSTVADNKFAADSWFGRRSTAIKSAALAPGRGPNRNNTYQSNEIAASLNTAFVPDASRAENCFFRNHDEHGRPRADMPDSRNAPCVPHLP